MAERLQHDARYYLGLFYFDAVAYGPEELGFVSEVVSRSKRFATGFSATKEESGATDRKIGCKRMFFGTDHPFFPPLKGQEKWKSVVENLEAIDTVVGWDQAEKDLVRGGNALSVFSLGK